jgi:hypothetical protein
MIDIFAHWCPSVEKITGTIRTHGLQSTQRRGGNCQHINLQPTPEGPKYLVILRKSNLDERTSIGGAIQPS